MTRRKKQSGKKPRVAPRTDAERAVADAAIRAFRETQLRLKSAQDPESSIKAYRAVFADFDQLARDAIEAAEDDDEPEVVIKNGVAWRAVLRCEQTYRCTRGEIRVLRKLYRAFRNGPTRCFFEERRGVLPGNFLPDLGRVVVEAVAEMPAERASKLLEGATGQVIPTATMKRTTVAVGSSLREDEARFFEDVVRDRPVPKEAKALVISVDGLSLLLRAEKWKQATIATVSFLDRKGRRLDTIRLAEMPEMGKATLYSRLKREVDAILDQRADLKLEVVVDGARDLRHALKELFPDAVHLTDFFHVAEHVRAALQALFPANQTERESTWFWIRNLLIKRDDGGEVTCRLLERMAKYPTVDVRKMGSAAAAEFSVHLAYLRAQLPFMNYAKARRAHLSIGSGVVEAACKTIVTQRLKVSGAQWSRPGAGAVLHLRALAQSDRLQPALAHQARRAAA